MYNFSIYFQIKFYVLLNLMYSFILCLSEIKKIESSARDHFKRIFGDHEKLKFQLETQKRDLELRGQELMKRETHNEIERKKLSEDLEQVFHMFNE